METPSGGVLDSLLVLRLHGHDFTHSVMYIYNVAVGGKHRQQTRCESTRPWTIFSFFELFVAGMLCSRGMRTIEGEHMESVRVWACDMGVPGKGGMLTETSTPSRTKLAECDWLLFGLRMSACTHLPPCDYTTNKRLAVEKKNDDNT